MKPSKSIEQQRQDALKYAEKQWGPDISKLSPPPPSKLSSPPQSSGNVHALDPTRSSNITPPLPSPAKLDGKREMPPTPPEVQGTDKSLHGSKKSRYASNHHAKDDHATSTDDAHSQNVHKSFNNCIDFNLIESSNSTTSTAATAAVVDPLVAAREQMKKLNEERAKAAGIAAAARLDKRNGKK